MADILQEITKWAPGKLALVRNLQKQQELPVDHHPFRDAEKRPGLSSSKGCVSKSPRAQSHSHTFPVYKSLLQPGSERRSRALELERSGFESELGNLLQWALISDPQNLPM